MSGAGAGAGAGTAAVVVVRGSLVDPNAKLPEIFSSLIEIFNNPASLLNRELLKGRVKTIADDLTRLIPDPTRIVNLLPLNQWLYFSEDHKTKLLRDVASFNQQMETTKILGKFFQALGLVASFLNDGEADGQLKELLGPIYNVLNIILLTGFCEPILFPDPKIKTEEGALKERETRRYQLISHYFESFKSERSEIIYPLLSEKFPDYFPDLNALISILTQDQNWHGILNIIQVLGPRSPHANYSKIILEIFNAEDPELSKFAVIAKLQSFLKIDAPTGALEAVMADPVIKDNVDNSGFMQTFAPMINQLHVILTGDFSGTFFSSKLPELGFGESWLHQSSDKLRAAALSAGNDIPRQISLIADWLSGVDIKDEDGTALENNQSYRVKFLRIVLRELGFSIGAESEQTLKNAIELLVTVLKITQVLLIKPSALNPASEKMQKLGDTLEHVVQLSDVKPYATEEDFLQQADILIHRWLTQDWLDPSKHTEQRALKESFKEFLSLLNSLAINLYISRIRSTLQKSTFRGYSLLFLQTIAKEESDNAIAGLFAFLDTLNENPVSQDLLLEFLKDEWIWELDAHEPPIKIGIRSFAERYKHEKDETSINQWALRSSLLKLHIPEQERTETLETWIGSSKYPLRYTLKLPIQNFQTFLDTKLESFLKYLQAHLAEITDATPKPELPDQQSLKFRLTTRGVEARILDNRLIDLGTLRGLQALDSVSRYENKGSETQEQRLYYYNLSLRAPLLKAIQNQQIPAAVLEIAFCFFKDNSEIRYLLIQLVHLKILAFDSFVQEAMHLFNLFPQMALEKIDFALQILEATEQHFSPGLFKQWIRDQFFESRFDLLCIVLRVRPLAHTMIPTPPLFFSLGSFLNYKNEIQIDPENPMQIHQMHPAYLNQSSERDATIFAAGLCLAWQIKTDFPENYLDMRRTTTEQRPDLLALKNCLDQFVIYLMHQSPEQRLLSIQDQFPKLPASLAPHEAYNHLRAQLLEAKSTQSALRILIQAVTPNPYLSSPAFKFTGTRHEKLMELLNIPEDSPLYQIKTPPVVVSLLQAISWALHLETYAPIQDQAPMHGAGAGVVAGIAASIPSFVKSLAFLPAPEKKSNLLISWEKQIWEATYKIFHPEQKSYVDQRIKDLYQSLKESCALISGSTEAINTQQFNTIYLSFLTPEQYGSGASFFTQFWHRDQAESDQKLINKLYISHHAQIIILMLASALLKRPAEAQDNSFELLGNLIKKEMTWAQNCSVSLELMRQCAQLHPSSGSRRSIYAYYAQHLTIYLEHPPANHYAYYDGSMTFGIFTETLFRDLCQLEMPIEKLSAAHQVEARDCFEIFSRVHDQFTALPRPEKLQEIASSIFLEGNPIKIQNMAWIIHEINQRALINPKRQACVFTLGFLIKTAHLTERMPDPERSKQAFSFLLAEIKSLLLTRALGTIDSLILDKAWNNFGFVDTYFPELINEEQKRQAYLRFVPIPAPVITREFTALPDKPFELILENRLDLFGRGRNRSVTPISDAEWVVIQEKISTPSVITPDYFYSTELMNRLISLKSSLPSLTPDDLRSQFKSKIEDLTKAVVRGRRVAELEFLIKSCPFIPAISELFPLQGYLKTVVFESVFLNQEESKENQESQLWVLETIKNYYKKQSYQLHPDEHLLKTLLKRAEISLWTILAREVGTNPVMKKIFTDFLLGVFKYCSSLEEITACIQGIGEGIASYAFTSIESKYARFNSALWTHSRTSVFFLLQEILKYPSIRKDLLNKFKNLNDAPGAKINLLILDAAYGPEISETLETPQTRPHFLRVFSAALSSPAHAAELRADLLKIQTGLVGNDESVKLKEHLEKPDITLRDFLEILETTVHSINKIKNKRALVLIEFIKKHMAIFDPALPTGAGAGAGASVFAHLLNPKPDQEEDVLWDDCQYKPKKLVLLHILLKSAIGYLRSFTPEGVNLNQVLPAAISAPVVAGAVSGAVSGAGAGAGGTALVFGTGAGAGNMPVRTLKADHGPRPARPAGVPVSGEKAGSRALQELVRNPGPPDPVARPHDLYSTGMMSRM